MSRDIFSSLPDMSVANVGKFSTGGSCTTDNNSGANDRDMEFADPGKSVERFGNGPYARFSGSCGRTSGIQTSAVRASHTTQSPAQSSSLSILPEYQTKTEVYIDGTTSITQVSQQLSTLTSSVSQLIPSTSSSSHSHRVSDTSPAALVASSAPLKFPSIGRVLTGLCSNEGDWNCVDGFQFQRCASGSWSVPMAMAAGTYCIEGESSELREVTIKPKSTREHRWARRDRSHCHHKYLSGAFCL
jgi:hypothetical protein